MHLPMLRALEIPVEDLKQVRQELQPDEEGYITYDSFLVYASQRLELQQDEEVDDEEHMAEVHRAFDLFTHNGPGPIHIAHLRRVARQLKEEVSDEQLINMIRIANERTDKRGWEAGVTMTEFERVLDQAGAWRKV
jgi:Ca2+-binding EF-hand superfamily protein